MAFVLTMLGISITLMLGALVFNRQAFNQAQTKKSKALLLVMLLAGGLSILFATTLIFNVMRSGS